MAVDGSSASNAALEEAIAIARERGGTLRVGKRHGARERSLRGLGQLHVVASVSDERLAEARIARMGKRLVDPSTGHDIAGQEDGPEPALGGGSRGIHDRGQGASGVPGRSHGTASR